jgi:alpha-beta hydrolase superfamily lysophospholipase
MKQIEGNFKSIRDLNIYYKGWLPDGDVKAVLLIVHGVGEYCERYTNVINRFVPLGYAIYGLDHIGHGKSGGEREMVARFEDFTEPLLTYFKMVKGWHPQQPIFIYGHSMGGLITSFYLLDHQADFKGAIISAPAVKIPDNISPLVITISKVLSTIAPKAGLIGLDTTYLSHDKALVDTYNADPLVFHGKMPARLSAEMLRAMLRVTAEAGKISLPLFILQGSGDKIVDPAGAPMLYEKVSSKDKTLKVYEGLYHEVHNEPDREKMFKDLETWLQTHI